jgi:nicotinamide-nucleotide amidase
MQANTPPSDAELAAQVRQLASLMVVRGWKMATAESCTGGWIAKCCTDLAGSSAWFERGFVTYSDQAKLDLLAVNAEALLENGAVSEAVVGQMASGARMKACVDAAVAVTGIAGPEGGTADKPVGTVWFGWDVGGAPVEIEVVCFKGDRDAVRRQTVMHALQGLNKRL